MDNAALPAAHLRFVGASLLVDGYFAAAHEERLRLTLARLDQAEWREGNGQAFELVLTDDWFVV